MLAIRRVVYLFCIAFRLIDETCGQLVANLDYDRDLHTTVGKLTTWFVVIYFIRSRCWYVLTGESYFTHYGFSFLDVFERCSVFMRIFLHIRAYIYMDIHISRYYFCFLFFLISSSLQSKTGSLIVSHESCTFCLTTLMYFSKVRWNASKCEILAYTVDVQRETNESS